MKERNLFFTLNTIKAQMKIFNIQNVTSPRQKKAEADVRESKPMTSQIPVEWVGRSNH